MKGFFPGFILYIVIGGLFVGWAAGLMKKECPNDHGLSMTEFAASVAIWPAVIAGTFTYDDGNGNEFKCEKEVNDGREEESSTADAIPV